MTRLRLFLGSLAAVLVCLLANGCYTQVGTARSDEDGQYGTEDQQSNSQLDSAVTEEQPAEPYPPPYYGYGYYPGFSLGFGWGYPSYYDPFWGPPAYSYYPYYYAPYPAYYGYYYPGYAYYPYSASGGGGHGVTRTFGNSRGSGVRGGDPYLRYPGGGMDLVRSGYVSGRLSPATVSSQSGRTVKGKYARNSTGRTASGATRTAPYSQPHTTRDAAGTTRGSVPQASRPSPSRSAPSAPPPSSSGGGRSQSSGPRGR